MDRGHEVMEVIRKFPGKDGTELVGFRHLRPSDGSLLRELEKSGMIEYRRGWYLTAKGDTTLMEVSDGQNTG